MQEEEGSIRKWLPVIGSVVCIVVAPFAIVQGWDVLRKWDVVSVATVIVYWVLLSAL
jgi:hypothetical protein